MKKNLQRFGASVLAAAMVAQSVALPAAAETTKIDSSVAQSVAASAASAASAVQSLPKFTSTADLIKQTARPGCTPAILAICPRTVCSTR